MKLNLAAIGHRHPNPPNRERRLLSTSFTMTSDLQERLKRASKAEGLTGSEYVRRAIEEYLSRHPDPDVVLEEAPKAEKPGWWVKK